MPKDVQCLKVEVPSHATEETPWHITNLSMLRFYEPVPSNIAQNQLSELIGYDIAPDWDQSPPGTDTHTVVNKKEIAVTPLSLDLTSRTNLSELKRILQGK
jgi:5'-nucleotidase